MKKAVFLDRDGVLNEMVYDEEHGLMDSARKPGQVRLMPGAAAFIRGARKLGYLVIVATNQPGLAKGTLSVKDLDAVNARLAELLGKEGAAWDDLRYCPHHPDGGPWAVKEFVRRCECRKPKPGLLRQAAADHGVDLGSSWMVGDGTVDVRAGRAAGCRTILVTKLKVHQAERFFDFPEEKPDIVAADLDAALKAIQAAGAKSEKKGAP